MATISSSLSLVSLVGRAKWKILAGMWVEGHISKQHASCQSECCSQAVTSMRLPRRGTRPSRTVSTWSRNFTCRSTFPNLHYIVCSPDQRRWRACLVHQSLLRIIATSLLLLAPESQTAQAVNSPSNTSLASSDLTGSARMRWWDIHTWVGCEEVSRPK